MDTLVSYIVGIKPSLFLKYNWSHYTDVYEAMKLILRGERSGALSKSWGTDCILTNNLCIIQGSSRISVLGQLMWWHSSTQWGTSQ